MSDSITSTNVTIPGNSQWTTLCPENNYSSPWIKVEWTHMITPTENGYIVQTLKGKFVFESVAKMTAFIEKEFKK